MRVHPVEPVAFWIDEQVTRRKRMHSIVDHTGESVWTGQKVEDGVAFLKEHGIASFLLVGASRGLLGQCRIHEPEKGP